MTKVSRESKIIVVAILTGGFFLVEIVSGYISGSIALIADSFHMLSDLLALGVAFYSIKLAKRSQKRHDLTFGFQRAEILGAFANSVFLLALCFTIIIEAIQRFVEPVHIENPMLVLIVGCLGLAMNILGMFLFHEHHGHSHDHGHSHSHAHSHTHMHHHGDEEKSHSHPHSHPINITPALAVKQHSGKIAATNSDEAPNESGNEDGTETPVVVAEAPTPTLLYAAQTRAVIIAAADKLKQPSSSSFKSHGGGGHTHHHVADEILPAAGNIGTLTNVQVVKRNVGMAKDSESDHHSHHSHDEEHHHHSHGHGHEHPHNDTHSHHSNHSHLHNHDHHGHSSGHHGHSHQNMNMHGLFLHVLGDALGSVGVIISALVIQFASGEWRYYLDPVISLFISGIIIYSTVPLIKSASFILLQGVPGSLSVEKLRGEILKLPG
ncbi:hypothetical protein HDU76_000631, partial [Blyttiomyces sp. JEL0837]